jgi:pimeloyl-ACP methyl ester carboxylesterase
MLGPEVRTTTLHGQQLSYVDEGTGSAVLFVHGLLGSHQNWTRLIGDLSADHRIIAPDLFGHGASAKPVGDYSLGSHAATLRDLLDRLGVRTVTLVGHSLGGGIAMQFAYLFLGWSWSAVEAWDASSACCCGWPRCPAPNWCCR